MKDKQEKDDKTFGSGGRSARIILIVCTLLYMVNYMDRQVLSVVLEPMKADLGLTDAQAGVLQTVFFLSMALLAFPISFLVDRWSRRKTVAVMAVVWSAATYVTGLGKSFYGVFFPRILVGTGEAGFSAGGTAWITAAYPPEKRGKALGFFNIAIALGSALGVMLGGYLSTNFGGWRTPFFVFAVPGVILGIIAFFLPDYKTVKSQTATSFRSVLADTVDLWRIPSLKWLFLGYGMHCLMGFSLMAWGPAMLMRTFKIPEATAGMIMGILGMFSIVGALLGGWLADAWYKRNNRGRMLLAAICDPVSAIVAILSVLAVMSVQAGGNAVSLSNPYVIVGLALGVLYCIFSLMGMPAVGAVTQDVVHPRLKGISWGMTMFSMFMLGGAWGPVVLGALSDYLGGGSRGLQIAMMITVSAGFLGGLCFWLSSRHYPADFAKVAGFKIEAEK